MSRAPPFTVWCKQLLRVEPEEVRTDKIADLKYNLRVICRMYIRNHHVHLQDPGHQSRSRAGIDHLRALAVDQNLHRQYGCGIGRSVHRAVHAGGIGLSGAGSVKAYDRARNAEIVEKTSGAV